MSDTENDFVSGAADQSRSDLSDTPQVDCKQSLGGAPYQLRGVTRRGMTVLEGLHDAADACLADHAGVSGDAIRPLEERFTLGSKLGKGGMGDVFSAQDSILNREVAVKVLTGKSGIGFARFVREAQVTAQLSHPNVVPVYGLEETDQGSPALTMKLIRGDTFSEYIDQCSAVLGTPEYDHERHGQTGRIEHFLRVCDAISYSNNRGVVHRDLKPDNLMLGNYGEVYVMDWGVARLQDDPESEPSTASPNAGDGPANITSDDEMKTRVGAMIGTPLYMAPEQSSGQDVGPKSDQFALGMVLFEMLTFEVPRDITDKSELVEKVASGNRHCFADLNLKEPVSLSLQSIVNRATAPKLDDRYPSVEEFSDDLRRYIHGEEIRSRPDNLIRSLWRRVQRQPVLAMSALLIALTGATIISTVSLYRGLEAERIASTRGQTLAGLVAKVNHRVNEFDALLMQVEGLLEGVATSSREQLEHASPQPYKIYQPDDLKGDNAPKDLAKLHRYQQRVSFENFVAVLPPEVELNSVQRQLFQLNGLKYVLRDALLRSTRFEVSDLDKKAADEILRKGTPVIWSYVSLESGPMLNYPGNEEYPEDYDARQRPWYVSAVTKKHGANWGIIYPDATGSGYLMPCNRPFYDRSGNLLGVAGLDLSMDTVIDQMDMPEIDGVRETWLIDGSGRVVLSSREKGRKTAISMNGNKTKELSILGISELEEHAKKGTTSGFVFDGKDVLVFARLRALPWMLVARIDPDSHDL